MEARRSSGNPFVLVVDDHAEVCRGLERLLRADGLFAAYAVGGAAALAWLGECTPDLILLDLMMPEVDGLEVLRRVRADPRTAALPVIVFSALAESQGREPAMLAGATDYWVKTGFNFDDLRGRLTAYLPD